VFVQDLFSLVCISVVTSVYRCPFICTICFCLHSFIHSFIHSFVQSDSQSVSQSVICSEWQVQIRQCVTQCQPDSKAQKRTLTAPFRLTTVTFKKNLKSTLLIVLLKAGKLVKLTEVGRLFHALIYDSVSEEIHSDAFMVNKREYIIGENHGCLDYRDFVNFYCH